jgi:hypothetical protein
MCLNLNPSIGGLEITVEFFGREYPVSTSFLTVSPLLLPLYTEVDVGSYNPKQTLCSLLTRNLQFLNMVRIIDLLFASLFLVDSFLVTFSLPVFKKSVQYNWKSTIDSSGVVGGEER